MPQQGASAIEALSTNDIHEEGAEKEGAGETGNRRNRRSRGEKKKGGSRRERRRRRR